MPLHLLDAMTRMGFEQVLAINHAPSGLRAFLAIHNTSRGPAFGGIRRFVYRDERESLLDCLRLARSMTYKCALADLPAGGAKLVIHSSGGEDWPAAYEHLGRVVNQFGGQFYTGPDVGTGDTELASVCRHTEFVTHPGDSGPGRLAMSTAIGVFHGIAAALRQLDGEESWNNRTVVIQGLGAVGTQLARELLAAGATVKAADLDEDHARESCEALGIEQVESATALDQECDVLAPCAMGGLVHDLSVARLRCRILAGAANNVLSRPLHGDELHRRGVLLVPDFVLNSGALIRGCLFHLEGRRESLEVIGQRVGASVSRVLERAADQDLPPDRVAVAMAEECLAPQDPED